jgi:hypothetical protein
VFRDAGEKIAFIGCNHNRARSHGRHCDQNIFDNLAAPHQSKTILTQPGQDSRGLAKVCVIWGSESALPSQRVLEIRQRLLLARRPATGIEF